MLSINEYLLYNHIVSNPNIIFEADDKSVVSYSDDRIWIDAKYCSIAIPLAGIEVLTIKYKSMLKGKDLQPVMDKYENKDTQGAAEELMELIKSHKDEFTGAMKEYSDDMNLEYIMKFTNAELHPPQGSKLKEFGVNIYIEFSFELKIAAPQPTIKKFSLGDLVFEGIGRVKTATLLKLILNNSDNYIAILKTLLNTYNSATGNEGDVDMGDMQKRLRNEMNKMVKNNIDKIKEKPETESNDEQVTELTGEAEKAVIK